MTEKQGKNVSSWVLWILLAAFAVPIIYFAIDACNVRQDQRDRERQDAIRWFGSDSVED